MATNTYSRIHTGTEVVDRNLLAIKTVTDGLNNDKLPYSGATTNLNLGTFGIVGVTDGSNAAAGNIGEYLESVVTGITSWVTNTGKNLTSLTLTPGDWDLSGSLGFNTASITGTGTLAQISTTSAGFDTSHEGQVELPTVPTTAGAVRLTLPTRRILISTNTTIFLVGRIIFSAGTPTAEGYLRARRMR